MDNNIQLITYAYNKLIDNSKITISPINKFKSFESFKYNLIDLNKYVLFKFIHPNGIKRPGHFLKENDFNPLKEHIEISKNTTLIVLLPQNLQNQQQEHIVNNLHRVKQFINIYFDTKIPDLILGLSETNINNTIFNSDFTFKSSPNLNVITKDNTNNPTTICKNNIIFTTLHLNSADFIQDFIDGIFHKKEIGAPDWFYDEEWFDDKKQKQIIEEKKGQIKLLEKQIQKSELKLEENNEYKSILYKQSKLLEKSVRYILGQLLNTNIIDFVDEKKEDFLIELDNVTFIGEIKGTKNNVKNKHITQLELHYDYRKDYTDKNNITENLKPLLIINREKDKPPKERNKVEQSQILVAKNKHNTLIITVESLLHLFEKFLNNEITSEDIIERFTNEEGLFEL